MKKSIIVASFLVIGASATGAAAIVSPYQGSDTLFNVTTQAIAGAGILPANAYVGGGSGNGQAAMVGPSSPYTESAATQQTAPMSRMVNSGNHVCSFNGGTNGSADTSAAGIVIGLDAVDILASQNSGASASCNGTADNAGTGLAYSGTTGVFAGSNATQTWKWVLALVYGGKDLSPGGVTDCNSAARKALVANWSSLFQNTCANGAGTACSAAPVSGALWHAFRRDDASGTSDVFASILGLSPSTSTSANNGFGTSPYCNALNWDTSTANANCALGANKQYTGPGGILDPIANDGVHRRPPVGTWGDNPDPSQGALGADVLPTQFQDNDPIRRPCLGGSTNNHNRVGEEVCNLDGALGLVVPMVDSDWMPKLATPLKQYPTNACTTFLVGKPVTVFTCATRGTGTKHSGECSNGDALIAGGCLVPVDSVNGTSQCVATKATVAALQNRSLGSPDGRHYNVQMRDGTVTEPTIGYAQYSLPALGTTLDFAAGYNRIHQVESTIGASVVGCQMVDMTDQIGCLTQADPCSIGYAGDGGKLFASHTNGATTGNGQCSGAACGTVGAIDSIRVAQVYGNTTSVQKLGTAGEYQLARKLYFSSLVGFANVAASSGDSQAADELTLAKYEATPANINPILTTNGFFTLGSQSPATTDTPFCEDFNEQTVCNPTTASASTLPANVNGCAGNPAGIPTAATICGNNVQEAYEECDDGLNNGTTGDHCSLTCRCVLDFNEATGKCN
jgi:cysteine-rich repeat protein